MIFHVSIESENPRKVAEFVAKVWGGTAMPLDQLVKGCWLAFCGGNPLSAVEVFPQGTDIVESAGESVPYVGPLTSGVRPTATHVALSTNLSREEVFSLAEREGWHAKFVDQHGFFNTIEVWISKHLVIEWLTPEMQIRYKHKMFADAGA